MKGQIEFYGFVPLRDYFLEAGIAVQRIPRNSAVAWPARNFREGFELFNRQLTIASGSCVRLNSENFFRRYGVFSATSS
jgi:hypothetical protein